MVDKGLTPAERLIEFKRNLQARRAREPWFLLARRVESVLAEGTAVGYAEDVIKSLVVETTGLSWGVLTRYLSTMRRVKMAAAAAGIESEDLLSSGFNGVEAAIRLYNRSASEGLDALKGLREGRLSVREVSQKLSRTDSTDTDLSRSKRLRGRGIAIENVEKALSRESSRLFPKDSTLRRRPPLRYFRRVGMEVRRWDETCVCGLDIMASEEVMAAHLELDDALCKSVLLSTYFPTFYLVFSAASPAIAVKEAVRALDLLDIRWVGVLKATQDGGIEIARNPVGGPIPDRTAEYESLRSKVAHKRPQ